MTHAWIAIVRVALTEHGMFGVLCDNGIPFAVTLEPDGEEAPYMPEGVHPCRRDFYHRGGYETFEIDIEGHDRVLFHRGNTERDTKMCVLVGEQFEPLNGKPAILQSGKGFAELMERVKGADDFLLHVVAPPT